MPDLIPAMMEHNNHKPATAIFITFSGNCKKALTLYQTLFGGTLQFNSFEQELQGYTEMPVVSGSLVSDSIIIHGSDLVHDEGRKPGNHMSIFLHCRNARDRSALITKLVSGKNNPFPRKDDDRKLIELTDAFDVRWVLGV